MLAEKVQSKILQLFPNLVVAFILVVALITGCVFFASRLTSSPTQTLSALVDEGEIEVSITPLEDGQYRLRLTHALTELDTAQFYVAGFMMAPEGQSLLAISEPEYILRAAEHLSSVEILITRPGRYQVAFYSYPLSSPIPTLTDVQIIEIGEESTVTPLPDETPIIVLTPTPNQTPSPTPSPALTPTPTARPAQPTPTASPTQPTPEPLRETPSSSVFRIYDVNTRYAYHQLSAVQKNAFCELYDGLVEGMQEISLTPCSEYDFYAAIRTLELDCPELFLWDYEEHFTYRSRTSSGMVVSMTPNRYVYTAAEYRDKLDQVLGIIRSFSNQSGFYENDFTKQRAIYDAIVGMSTYSLDLPYCAYADSVYLYGYSKCTGYAHALNLALRYYGIPCFAIVGDTYDDNQRAPSSHMWNIVQIEGNWYHCDATWDDDDTTPVRHAYLNLPDRLMWAARIIDSERLSYFTLPSCDSLKWNAVSREGIIVGTDANVENIIRNRMADILRSGGGSLQFLLYSGADYQTACSYLRQDSFWKSVVRAAGHSSGYSWSYLTHPDVNYVMITIMPGN